MTLLREEAGSLLEVEELTVQAEDAAGRTHERPLGLVPLLVGSGAEAALSVEDPRVSRRHLELRRTPNGVRVADLESKNGTFVNQVRICDAYLGEDEWVHFGGSKLRLVRGKGVERLPLAEATQFGEVLGRSPVMRALFASLQRAASTDVSILLTGETGTGKDGLARAVHEASGRRAGPFVVFDCAATAPTLVEARLFGSVKGAYTGADEDRAGLFAAANGGTLFLDELGELPLESQSRLLRALETRTIQPVGATEYTPVDVRVIAATHRDLLSAVAHGTFRKDLYYRVAVVLAQVPPLRERREDLPLLIETLLARQRPPRKLSELAPHVLRLLERHDWPGNVRELSNTLTRLTLMPSSVDLAELSPAGASSKGAGAARNTDLPLKEARALVVAEFEHAYIREKLREHGGNVTHAANDMGISRQFLYRMMDTYGLREDER